MASKSDKFSVNTYHHINTHNLSVKKNNNSKSTPAFSNKNPNKSLNLSEKKLQHPNSISSGSFELNRPSNRLINKSSNSLSMSSHLHAEILDGINLLSLKPEIRQIMIYANPHAFDNHGSHADLNRRPYGKQLDVRYNTKFTYNREFADASYASDLRMMQDFKDGLLGRVHDDYKTIINVKDLRQNYQDYPAATLKDIEHAFIRVNPFHAEEQLVHKNDNIAPACRNRYLGNEVHNIYSKGRLVTSFPSPNKFNSNENKKAYIDHNK